MSFNPFRPALRATTSAPRECPFCGSPGARGRLCSLCRKGAT